jgi:outer membrane protein OmpA-like peptidoglycan-associated protein
MTAPAQKSIQTDDLQSATQATVSDARRQALVQLGIETESLIHVGMTVGLIDGNPVLRIPTALFFNSDQAQIKPESHDTLVLLVSILQARKDTHFTLFTNGSKEGALPLLEAARGLGILNAIVSAGLPANQIELTGGFNVDLQDQIGTEQPIEGDALHIRFTPRMTNHHRAASAKPKPQLLKATEAKN